MPAKWEVSFRHWEWMQAFQDVLQIMYKPKLLQAADQEVCYQGSFNFARMHVLLCSMTADCFWLRSTFLWTNYDCSSRSKADNVSQQWMTVRQTQSSMCVQSSREAAHSLWHFVYPFTEGRLLINSQTRHFSRGSAFCADLRTAIRATDIPAQHWGRFPVVMDLKIAANIPYLHSN